MDYRITDGYKTPLDYCVRLEDDPEIVKRLTTTKLYIANARRYQLQKTMTDYRLQLSYYYCR